MSNQVLGQRDPDTVKRMSRDMKIPIFQLRELEGDDVELLREIGTMRSIQTLTATALNTPDDASRRRVLRERRDHLRGKVQRWQASARPRVSRIRLSVFGFSRGAAEARVFCNWLQDALDPDGRLCGIPLQVDFLGIFDTVASVGMANSSLVFDGHGGWGREADLRVPARVRRCVHVVAAHEVRGSFPLDAFRGDCPSALQLVYPGVHSDIGGGYQVGEQGKGFLGSRGADTAKLSQLPLGAMYNEAVAAGVPLNLQADGLPQDWKDAFRVDETLSRAYADYVAADGGRQSGELRALVQDEYGKYLRWRRLRLGEAAPHGLRHQPFVSRARARDEQDAIDLVEANRELAQEAAAMPGRDQDPALRRPGDGLRAQIDHVVGRMARSFVGVLALRDSVVRALYAEKVAEWREVHPPRHSDLAMMAQSLSGLPLEPLSSVPARALRPRSRTRPVIADGAVVADDVGMSGQDDVAAVEVVAGVISDARGRVLLTRRTEGRDLAGLWEFPGGKREPGESAEAALVRELDEELGIRADVGAALIAVPQRSAHKRLRLDVRRVDTWRGTPKGREGQAMAWVPQDKLVRYEMPPADRPVVAALLQPPRYAITPAPDADTRDEDWLAGVERLLAGGVGRLQVRLPGVDAGRRARLVAGAALLARAVGAQCLVNGDAALAAEHGCGLHLPAAQLRALRARPVPAEVPLAASCHDREQLQHAQALGCDFVVLGPVAETASHPGAVGIGWTRFAALREAVSLPIYAIGGLGPDDLAAARAHGGQGIAAIRSFWNAPIATRPRRRLGMRRATGA